MSVKKLTTYIAVGVASLGVTAAVAGGPDYAPPPPPTDQGIYLEANGGWVGRNWTSFAGNTLLAYPNASNVKKGRGGWSGGGALGYQLNRQFAFEVGYWKVPDASGTVSQAAPAQSFTSTIKSWFAYSAFKGLLPLGHSVSVFGKIGGAYTWNLSENGTKGGGSQAIAPANGSQVVSDYFNVMFGAGVQFNLGSPSWIANAQYMYLPGYNHNPSDSFTAPAITVYSVGLAYKLLV